MELLLDGTRIDVEEKSDKSPMKVQRTSNECLMKIGQTFVCDIDRTSTAIVDNIVINDCNAHELHSDVRSGTVMMADNVLQFAMRANPML
jgi:hypothetical protein